MPPGLCDGSGMIGVDWGTSNFRAYRLRDGAVVDRIAGGPALLTVAAGGFGAALRGAIGAWLEDGERRVLLSGMIGSRQGWVEAPYLPCPADLSRLTESVVRVAFEDAEVGIVPGVSAEAEGVPEVMRGEEVQLFGVMEAVGDGLVCLPGSHSKWVRVEGGGIAGFRTHMTGEAFAALRGHTILGRGMVEGPHVPGAFARGVMRAQGDGGLLHQLFGVRTLGLFGALPETEAGSYLSGLLIGHELRGLVAGTAVRLVGSAGLCGLYAEAIGLVGGVARVLDGDAAAAGLARIGERLGWT